MFAAYLATECLAASANHLLTPTGAIPGGVASITRMENFMRAIVEYSVMHVRTVRVVIDAHNRDMAVGAVLARASDGSLWDDTPECRLIHDETDQGRPHGALYLGRLKKADPVSVDTTVTAQQRLAMANVVVEQLVEAYRRAEETGSINWSEIDAAHALACECQL